MKISARAMKAADELFLQYYAARAAERSGQGQGHGERPSAGMARREVELVEITEPRPGKKAERITALGWKTARTKLPKVIARMKPEDGRRRAAEYYGAAVEAMTAAGGTSFLQEVGSGFVSDGGATSRVKLGKRVRVMREVLDGIAPFGPARLRGRMRLISARVLADSVFVDGMDLKQLLIEYGWNWRSEHSRELSDYTLRVLDDLAYTLGFASAKRVDKNDS